MLIPDFDRGIEEAGFTMMAVGLKHMGADHRLCVVEASLVQEQG